MENLMHALSILLTFKVISFILIGIVTGIIAGALPGLTATMSIALLSPFTYEINPPLAGLMVLLGVYVGAMHGGAISAILLRTPGTPAAAATCFDGYPLAQQGKAALALNVSTFASTTGGVISTLILITVAAPIAKFALKFGPFEMFCLALFGLSIISGVSEGSTIKGLIMGALGMLFASVGRSATFDVDRLTFGFKGMPESDLRYIPIMIGVFAVTEALTQVEAGFGAKRVAQKFKNMFPSAAEWKRLLLPLGIGSAAGTIVGAIPGAGGDIASFVAYDQTKKASRNKELFGKGAIEGVAASESANNGVTGGAMIPMLTLGIPGDSVTAILIGAMIVMGLQPGPALFASTDPHIRTLVIGIFAGLLFANIIVLPLRLAGAGLFTRVITIAPYVLWPLVTVFCVVGSFSMTGSMISVYIMMAFGIFGYLMKKLKFPPGPLILGVILGPMAEANLHRALIANSGPWTALFSPLAIALIVLALMSAVLPALQSKKAAGD